MDWTGFFSTLLARVPIERLLFPAPDRSKDIQQFLTATGSPVEAKEGASEHKPTSSVQAAAAPPPRMPPAQSLPTQEEVTRELKLRLAMELYKAESDLVGKLRIAGKPCDCLLVRHPIKFRSFADEVITKDPENPIYYEIMEWLDKIQAKTTPEAIVSGLYDNEYPRMGAQAADFAKRIGQTIGLPALPTLEPVLTLEKAKKVAADEAAKEVERVWSSQKAK